jgi:hypothetical protein
VTAPAARSASFLAAGLIGLGVVGCGGDPLAWVPDFEDPHGILDLREAYGGGCVYLWRDDGGSHHLTLPAGWTVRAGTYLQPPSASEFGIPDGAEVRVRGEAGGTSSPGCNGDPFVVEEIEVIRRPE